jgi:hypothetical protein
VPGEQVNVSPTAGVPEMIGEPVFRGRWPGMATLFALAASALPALLVALTRHEIDVPPSSLVTTYVWAFAEGTVRPLSIDG